MSSFPNTPRLIKGGIILLNPSTAAVQRIIALQYNPDTLTRSFQIKGVGAEGGDRREVQRLLGPPVETIKLDAEIDAADQLEFPENNPNAARYGIHPHLAALETMVYPTSRQVQANDLMARMGTLEIAPMESPLTLFIWSRNRILPVLLTELSITEEAFDPSLNPLRAKVSLGMRVLNGNDLPAGHKGASLFMAHHRQKELFASLYAGVSLPSLGVDRIV